jgi:hypothetical protein
MRMIPSFIEDTSPPGERVVFSLLQNSSKNWVALHSLDLAPDNHNRRTEIDFVVIIPDHGIFCIEVKSQKDIFFDGNIWQPDSIVKSPFKQALDGRFAFHRRINSKLQKKYAHVPVMHLCVFTHSDFYVGDNASIKPWELADRNALNNCRGQDGFCKLLISKFIGSVGNDLQVTRLSKPLLDIEVEEIVDFCYPIRKRKPENAEEVKRRQNELENKLQLQQKPLLKLCELNKRVLVKGGAGTGKSLIGIEIAKRKAESGLRVAYLCYNRLIGKWAESELKQSNLPNIVAGSIYSILLKISDITPPLGSDTTWWNEMAPTLIEDKLTSPEIGSLANFDYVVIDEAQDILARPELWELTLLLIEGGLTQGGFLILGDFTNQSLTDNPICLEQNLKELSSNATCWQLDENCRNYQSIGQVALTLSASPIDTWSGYMREGGSLSDWNLFPYQNDTEQANQVIECMQSARSDGFSDEDITILSFCSIERSIVKSLVGKGILLEKAEELNSQNVRYSTINAFKGMENKVIIITDVIFSPQNQNLNRRIFYTGMTRATEKLYIICRQSSVNTLQQWAFGKD